MNCRMFHRNLEDYLEGGLDFPGRFAMERHAQQCVGCGRELSDAQRLRQMVSELQRVKAPADFEASVLNEIGKRKAHARFQVLRNFWVYGVGWPSLGRLALVSSCLAVLALGAFYSLRRIGYHETLETPRVAVDLPLKAEMDSTEVPHAPGAVKASLPPKDKPVKETKLAEAKPSQVTPQIVADAEENLQEAQGLEDMDYVEYLMPGLDNRPVQVRLPLPKVIPMRYVQMSEDYFIQNVSH